ncbi:acyltransferase domain-containing protein [Hirsutella rhossiliensis]|uniref:1-acyl-sn-glycerol-3-phosphate acyltransferase n=1 Tax=Hirsutella rhossiliensis TaxID=111463 RepID=A0A9P8N3K0_9HYPO|nr:acyltransferase domain-containing protein [Hirsutella rhossiliensis]KAH0965962.1 acyltransferase domain-containing protein [Hirsutella rhossiliensis]
MAALIVVLAKLLFGYLAVTAFFFMLSVAVPRAGFVARVLAAYVTLVFTAIVNIIASVVLRLAGQQNISQWVGARIFHESMRRTIGVSFTIDDPGNLLATVRPAVFVGNHQTELDVVMLGAMFPKYCSVTAKSDLKHVPFLGWFMHASGTIFIDRKNSKGAREAMQGAAQEMRAKRQSVYIFPEGTRSYAKDPVLLPFKKGAFHLAIQAGVPIIPCVVANYSHIFSLKDMVFKSGTVPVKVLDPIPTDGLTAADVDDLARRTRDIMLDEYVALSAKVKGQPMPMPASTADAAASKVISSGVDAAAISSLGGSGIPGKS